MTTGAIIFMAMSWMLVLGLTAWSFGMILRHPGHHGTDDTAGRAGEAKESRPSASGSE